MCNNNFAKLSNKGEYTLFSFGNKTLTFLTSKNLEKYTAIKEWDNGYIVVMAKNKNNLSARRKSTSLEMDRQS